MVGKRHNANRKGRRFDLSATEFVFLIKISFERVCICVYGHERGRNLSLGFSLLHT